MRMRSGCFERGSVLAGDRAPSGDASIKSTDTSSWPPTWDNRPTAHIAEILSGRKHTHTHTDLSDQTYLLLNQPGLNADSSVCDLIGACWGSRGTSVRVSTFLWRIPISQVTLRIMYYLSRRTQEGLHVAEWQLWFGRKPPSRRVVDERHYTHIHCDT